MRTDTIASGATTTLAAEDHAKIARLLSVAEGRITLPALGRFEAMSTDDVWFALVSQVCVMGSARGMEAIVGSADVRQSFIEASRPALMRAKGKGTERLAAVLSEFKATRFPTKNAAVLREIVASPSVYSGSRFVLFDGLVLGGDRDETRRTLRDRVRRFNLKSASDFMITTGLSDDVMALDTRVVGALRRYFGYTTPVGLVQSKPEVYLSVERALRSACAEIGKPLALLDRAIFQLAGRSALDFILTAR